MLFGAGSRTRADRGPVAAGAPRATTVRRIVTAVIASPAVARPSLPRRVLGVPFRPQTWRHVLYLLLAFPLGVVYFVVLVAGVSVGGGLAVVVVGLFVLGATVMATRVMAGVERWLACRLLGVTIPRPAHMDPGLRLRERARSLLRDPVTWKSVVFVALKLPTGLVSLAVFGSLGFTSAVLTLAPAIVTATPVTIFGWVIETPAEALPVVPAGLAGLLLLLNLANGMAWLAGLLARVMLGPSTVQLRERVDDLRHARARIIEAADGERRRLERDLHDGAQQRLVSLSLTLGLAESRLKTDPDAAAPLVSQAREEARMAVQELRELARGLHPAVLSDRGLGPALEALASRAPVPVTVTGVPERRLPAPVEAAAYFVVAEALTNVAKYAEAESATVALELEHGVLRVRISDDGRGGADPAAGTGLRGLRDRVDALDGMLRVESPPGAGTALTAELPLAEQ
jgi:signal transduction histidine kinase